MSKQNGNKGRRFDRAFKEEAVRLLQTSGAQAAADSRRSWDQRQRARPLGHRIARLAPPRGRAWPGAGRRMVSDVSTYGTY